MRIIQLLKEGKEILGSDGIMYVDGRLKVSNILNKVKDRNKSYSLHFPHKVADQFAVYRDRIGGAMYAAIKIHN